MNECETCFKQALGYYINLEYMPTLDEAKDYVQILGESDGHDDRLMNEKIAKDVLENLARMYGEGVI